MVTDILFAVLVAVVDTEIFLQLDWRKGSVRMVRLARNLYKYLISCTISDKRKEMLIIGYSQKLAICSATMLFRFCLLLAPVILGVLLRHERLGFLAILTSAQIIGVMVCVSVIYFVLRQLIGRFL